MVYHIARQSEVSSGPWPVVVSRPDAAYAVGVLSQFIQNPGQAHWEGLKRVISYLGTTKDLWLTFGGKGETLEGFCDADWASQKHRPRYLVFRSITDRERYPGARRSKASYAYQALKQSTSRRRMPQRKRYGYENSSVKSEAT